MGIIERLRGKRRQSPATASAATALPPLATTWDAHGATITIPQETWDALEHGRAPSHITEQSIVLTALEEAGRATREGSEYHLDVDTVGRLDDDDAAMLDLPPVYTGSFATQARGNTTTARFQFTVDAEQDGIHLPIDRTGAMMTLGTGAYAEHHRLPMPLIRALEAVENHQQVPERRRSDTVNLELIAELQAAKKEAGQFQTLFAADEDAAAPEPRGIPFPIDLGYFDNFVTHVPERVRVTVEEQEDGSLQLTPDLGTNHSPEQLNSRWHQLQQASADGGVLRVDDHLVLLRQEQLRGVRDVHRHQQIPAERAEDFWQAPGDFLGPHVDGDTFSTRVRAVGVLEPVSFEQKSQGKADWFGEADGALDPEEMVDLLETPEQFTEYEDTIERTWEQGGTTIPHNEDYVIDVSDQERVRGALEEVRRRVGMPDIPTPPKPEDATSVGFLMEESAHSGVPKGLASNSTIAEAPVDLSGLKFTPYPHQHEGIDWLVERMRRSLQGEFADAQRVQGALLADDMGLGKTFMAWVALRQFSQDLQELPEDADRAHLLVVPLTLVENWKAELSKSFDDSPFDDVVVLQGDGLRRFRLQGTRRETEVSASQLRADGTMDTDDLRLSLTVGEEFGKDRLDKPGRIVLTTYDTLASYQLSLGSVRWGAVIFDEAQDIKNPDSLRTRASKGLQARFKLVATGTPVENSLRDIWCLMDTAQPGALGTWLEFKQRWVTPQAEASAEKKRVLGKQLAEEVRPLMLRRNKEDHLPNLPSKTIHTGIDFPGAAKNSSLGVTMPGRQAEAYSTTLRGHNARTGQKGAALQTLQKLRSISLHPDATDKSWNGGGSWQDGARMLALMEVLDQIRDTGEKAIVFVINKAAQRRLAGWLSQRYGRRVHVINGDTKASSGGRGGAATRSQLIRDFEQVEGFNVIIMSPVAAGRGLTVTQANHAIHLERQWNPAKEAQATDRVYRIGQDRPVHVYLPMALHPDPSITSFDENLNHLLTEKTVLKDAVMVPEKVEEQEVMGRMGLG